jgi:hypothetical protein
VFGFHKYTYLKYITDNNEIHFGKSGDLGRPRKKHYIFRKYVAKNSELYFEKRKDLGDEA